MTENSFQHQASAELSKYFDILEEINAGILETDWENGNLRIDIDGKGTFLLNKHAPNEEIWLSSPLSGAWHFKQDPQGNWISTRPPLRTLRELLGEELSGILAQSVHFA